MKSQLIKQENALDVHNRDGLREQSTHVVSDTVRVAS